MDLDPEDLFRDDEDDPENEFYQERDYGKEMVVYVVDASPKMFNTLTKSDDMEEESHFHIAVDCICQSLKTQIINRSYDEVAVCFFNTREKKNLQDLNGVFVFNVMEREDLDRPTARFIKEFDCIEETFMKEIGSQYGIISGSRENSLYNALWVAQALLRKGSAKTADKRILLFTNEDDPFGSTKGAIKADMTRTTIQRAKDARDLGISIELLPLSRPDEEFNISLFYADLIGLEGEELAQFITSAGERLEDMKDQLRKRMFAKRKIRRITFLIANGISIELNTYALIRPTLPGAITWLDSVTNRPLKTERSFICADTGALVQEPSKRFQSYKGENIQFSTEELSQVKRVSMGPLRLLGFKPLSCLKDYHNLRPSTFVFPSDEEILGSTRIFIALHRSMLKLGRFAVAFYGTSSHPQMVALVAQDEITSSSGQVEPPGMHMIYLPYSDDIRHVEEHHMSVDVVTPRATDDQIKKATALLKRVDLKDFSVCQFSNPDMAMTREVVSSRYLLSLLRAWIDKGPKRKEEKEMDRFQPRNSACLSLHFSALQRHYAIIQALALEEDEMPELKDETLPDEEGLARQGIVNAMEEFKVSVYGENFNDEEADSMKSGSEASKKRKATSEAAAKECAKYDWAELAKSGKLNDLTVVELKYYLTAHNLPVTGKKDILISRILTHLRK